MNTVSECVTYDVASVKSLGSLQASSRMRSLSNASWCYTAVYAFSFTPMYIYLQQQDGLYNVWGPGILRAADFAPRLKYQTLPLMFRARPDIGQPWHQVVVSLVTWVPRDLKASFSTLSLSPITLHFEKVGYMCHVVPMVSCLPLLTAKMPTDWDSM